MNANGRLVTGGAIVAVIFLGGCAEVAGEDVAEEAMAVAVDNGIHMNGLSTNGIHMNGIHMNGLSTNGTSLNGFYATGMSLHQTSFTGIINGEPTSGLGFIGALMTATLPDGSTRQIRIDDIEPSTTDPEILLYDVSSSADGVNWSPLCVGSTGAPVRSYPLMGHWDESEGTATGGDRIEDPAGLTFACQGYAIAKCVEMGYKPWRTRTECKTADNCETRSLAPYHQACIRMLRADYCGNGTSATRNGTVVDVRDNLGVQLESQNSWGIEAEWGTDGATCIQGTRLETMASVSGDGEQDVKDYIANHCPERWKDNSACAKPSSTFFKATGFSVPLATRSLLITRALMEDDDQG